MKKSSIIICLCGVWSMLLAACTQEEWENAPNPSDSEMVFKLRATGYEGTPARSQVLENVKYDRIAYYIIDEAGELVKDIKSRYEPSASSILVEGLHAGNYRLLVLGIQGDASKDRAVIHELAHASDTWLDFPSDLQKPLEAEYFYSQTPFSVRVEQSADGQQEVVSMQKTVEQKRVIGRVDFDFSYHNKYVSNTVVSKTLRLKDVRFATSLSGEGTYSGKSNGKMEEINLNKFQACRFMPTVDGSRFAGEIAIQTRNYSGEKTLQEYSFEQQKIEANHLNTAITSVQHPDDKSGIIFISAPAYAEGNHKQILQDNEPKEIYSDAKQRSFNTSQPLQISITEAGQLHLRFYCPRGMSGVLIKGKLPVTGGEYVDLAYLDTIPPFADFYEDMPLLERAAVYRTESGRQIEIPRQEASALQGGTFKAESESECWKRLQYIKYGMEFWFDLHGANPDAPNGGPVGNWIGIRPIHCREMIAFFLNYAYMVSMPEVETLMKNNADKLYDDAKKPVTPERVLEQMRQYRYLSLGLVHGSVSGLASPSLWSVSEGVLKGLYYHAPSLERAFHEFGHVMGYMQHASAFTYGPWAQELMNNFYLKHLKEFPIDNPSYVDLANNEHLYTK